MFKKEPVIENPENTELFEIKETNTSPAMPLEKPLKIKKRINAKVLIVIILSIIALVSFVLWLFLKGNSNFKILNPFSSGKGSSGETVMNPLTGIMYSEDEAREWVDERPLGVMMNNYTDARPQSGISQFDILYEIVAEGGITRYLPFFLTNDPTKIGPVRSTREYYLVLVKELGDAMIMHIGWSPQALIAIETWPVRSLGRGDAPFWRDNPRNVAVEHTAYVNAVELRKVAEENLGWEGTREFDTWEFKDEKPINSEEQCLVGECDLIKIDFWYEGDYTGMFKYDRATNSYLRFTGYDVDGNPIKTIDENNNEQVSVKNLIIQFATEIPIAEDDKNRLEYDLVGSGQGLVFMDGTVKEVTWTKEGRDDRTLFYDTNGNEVQFNRGRIWVSIVPDRNVEQVYY